MRRDATPLRANKHSERARELESKNQSEEALAACASAYDSEAAWRPWSVFAVSFVMTERERKQSAAAARKEAMNLEENRKNEGTGRAGEAAAGREGRNNPLEFIFL